MSKRNILIALLVVFSISLSSFSFYIYQVINSPNILVDKESRFLYIPTGASFSEVQSILYQQNLVNNMVAFSFLAKIMNYDDLVKPGKYLLEPNMNNREAIRMLRAGEQVPVNITFNNVRLLEELPFKICRGIELEPGNFQRKLEDSITWLRYGYDQNTFKCMFIPNTYEVYWTITADELLDRMYQEHEAFWDPQRKQKADSIGLDSNEVTILASIVKAECKMQEEAPVIAGLYINRLQRNYALQADPTVVYANKDFTIKRVLNKHKEIDSPYNTYLYPGLPPGPINMPEPVYIDAILNYSRHNYLYMVAKEDFSGFHYFSSNLREHLRYAARYQRALNREGIFR
jgi:UPF0755 protein